MSAETVVSPWRTRGDRSTQRDAKRTAVLEAAARLFIRKGFQDTSLDEVAASLHVTKPTLYHYVENKEEILFECVRRGLSAVQAGISLAAAQGLSGRNQLEQVLRCYAAVVTSDFGLCVIRVGEDPLSEPRRREMRALKARIDQEFRGLVEQGIAQGWIVPGDTGMVAHTVVGTLSAVGRWYQPDRHLASELHNAVDHCIAMLLSGVLGVPRPDATVDPPSAAGTREGPSPVGTTPMAAARRRERHFGQRVVRCFTERPRNLAAMLQSAVQRRPEGEALVCGPVRLTWRALHHAASHCAAGLALRGVRPGDRVALFLPNSPEFAIAVLACAWMGAVAVPLSARLRGAELQHVLHDSGAVALVCARHLAGVVPDRGTLPALAHRLLVDITDAPAPESTNAATAGTGRLGMASDGPAGFEPFAALLQAAEQAQPHDAHEDDLAVLLYTSGTTGMPKGAMLTHLNIAHSVRHFELAMQLTEQDRTLVAGPLSHVQGLVAQLFTLLHCAGTAVLLPDFKAAAFVRLAARERITHTIMVPAMYSLCLLLPDLQDHDLTAWRIGAYGGSTMPTAAIQAMSARLPGLTLMNAYGATETCSPATLLPAGEALRHQHSVGLPVVCGDIQIVDNAGREVPPGEVGEIWIAGPMVVPGYWRNEAATASNFCAGYWRSGDLGRQDAAGYVQLLDRQKDVVNRGGYKVYGALVENALAEHPQVVESALVGVPCAVLGERVHAFVCVRALDASTTAPALQAFCTGRLADYAVPETWTIGTEPLPRNLNGKVLKSTLRRSLQAALT